MEQKTGFLDTLLSKRSKERIGVHYLATCLMLAWYYSLWFTPNIFIYEDLLATSVTYSWLATLAASGVSFLVVAFIVNRSRRSLYKHPGIVVAASFVAAIATASYTLWSDAVANPIAAMVVFPLMFGVANAIIWIGLGEYHARNKSTFSTHKFLGMFGAVMMISMLLTTIMPHPLAVTFVTLLPLASAMLYIKGNTSLNDAPLPTLLPAKTRKKTSKATLIISLTIFVACTACYFNIAIIPTDMLSPGGIWPDGMSYVVGISLSGLAALIIALCQGTFAKKAAITYRLLPWLLVVTVVAIALFANGDTLLYPFSFIITVMLAGVFEVVLIAYFGTLSSKGFIATAVAFGVSSAVVRLGFFMGDTWAVIYEHNEFLARNLTVETSLMLVCLLAVCLIPLLRQEGVIVQLTSPQSRNNELEEVCDAAITEFALSKREGEILKLFARGYTIDSISKKLVISPYTTQTHVRHIYSKMHVHKRSELLDYINMHRTEQDQ